MTLIVLNILLYILKLKEVFMLAELKRCRKREIAGEVQSMSAFGYYEFYSYYTEMSGPCPPPPRNIDSWQG